MDELNTDLCRLCMVKADDFGNNLKLLWGDQNLLKKIEDLTGIKVADEPNSRYICVNCHRKIDEIEEFVEKCRYVNSVFNPSIEDDSGQLIEGLQENELNMKNPIFSGNLELDKDIKSEAQSIKQEPDELKNNDADENCSIGKKIKPYFTRSNTPPNSKIPCRICNFLIEPKLIANHLIIHTDIFKCKKCGVRHASRYSLERHLKTFHGTEAYVCHLCGYRSTSILTINRHINSHFPQGTFRCRSCSYKTTSTTKFDQHLNQHSRTLLKPFYPTSNQTQQILKHETKYKKQKVFVCNININDRGVKKSYENEYFVLNPILYQCTKCKKLFSSKIGLTRHTKSLCGKWRQEHLAVKYPNVDETSEK